MAKKKWEDNDFIFKEDTQRFENKADLSDIPKHATLEEVKAGAVDNKTVTPKTLADALPTIAPLPKIATQPEAEIGEDNMKMMTPLRTKNAIDKQTPVISQTVFDDNKKMLVFFGTLTEWQALSENVQKKYVLVALRGER